MELSERVGDPNEPLTLEELNAYRYQLDEGRYDKLWTKVIGGDEKGNKESVAGYSSRISMLRLVGDDDQPWIDTYDDLLREILNDPTVGVDSFRLVDELDAQRKFLMNNPTVEGLLNIQQAAMLGYDPDTDL